MSPKKTKAEREQARREFLYKEMAGHSALDRWFGVEGLSAPMGHPRFATDDVLASSVRRMRRGLEDVREGFAECAEPDLSNEQVEQNLAEVEREIECREALRHAYGARESPAGTHIYDEWYQAGGISMVAAARREGQEPLVAPSYKLALYVDHGRWLLRRKTALDWSAAVPETERNAVWANAMLRSEFAAYSAWMEGR